MQYKVNHLPLQFPFLWIKLQFQPLMVDIYVSQQFAILTLETVLALL